MIEQNCIYGDLFEQDNNTLSVARNIQPSDAQRKKRPKDIGVGTVLEILGEGEMTITREFRFKEDTYYAAENKGTRLGLKRGTLDEWLHDGRAKII